MEQPSDARGTIYSEDIKLCESPVSPVSESGRPALLNAASPWRDQIEYSNDTINHETNTSDAGHSSTCRDQGYGAHLEKSSDSNAHPTRSTPVDELLASIGTGIDSQDPGYEFSDIPFTRSHDKTLEDKLRSAIRKNPRNDGERFIPIGDFDKIITRENVQREVKSWLPDNKDLETWVKAIWDPFDYRDSTAARGKALTSRRQIFAILVLFNAQTKIASFIREELWDKDLPFIQNENNKWVYHPRRSQNESCFVESLNRLEVHDADSFGNYQWFMLSPIFNMAANRVIHYDLHPRITLPFLEHERGHNPALIGGQGEVSRIKVHESHYVLTESMKDPPKYLAIKQLTSPDKGQFNAEVESLKMFSHDDHPHLIRLLATYHHKEKFHLVFPWANGNLRDLWKRHPTPDKSYSTVLWIANQCSGIANGLRMIHNNEFKSDQPSLWPSEKKLGRHGDMKPENILWFKGCVDNEQLKNDVLKISDFGLTRWHGNASNDKTDIHKLAISRSYRAPEYDLWKPVSQSWDIWSLACLYLEFITWYLCGWNEGVDEFSKERTKENANLTREANYAISEDDFFNLITKSGSKFDSNTKYEASLKRSVVSWINKLHATEGCSQFIHDFLDLISDKMLRIRSEKRTRCEDITRILNDLCNKCLDEDYCFKNYQGTRRKRRNDSDPPDNLDTAIIEFSKETTKRLSQRISLESGARAINDNHDQGVGTESIQPSHLQLDSQDDQPQPSLDDSNQQILSSEQSENGSLITPTPHAYPTKSDSTNFLQATKTENVECSSQQTLSGDSQISTVSLPTSHQRKSNAISHGLRVSDQNQASSSNSVQGSTLSPPTDDPIGCTSSEQDRASSQKIKWNSQKNTDNIQEKRHKSIWKKLQGWVRSVSCLRGGTMEG